MRNTRRIRRVGPGLIRRIERREGIPVRTGQRIAQLAPSFVKRVYVNHGHELSKRLFRRQGHHSRQHGLPFPVIGGGEGGLQQSAEGLGKHRRHRGVGGVQATQKDARHEAIRRIPTSEAIAVMHHQERQLFIALRHHKLHRRGEVPEQRKRRRAGKAADGDRMFRFPKVEQHAGLRRPSRRFHAGDG